MMQWQNYFRSYTIHSHPCAQYINTNTRAMAKQNIFRNLATGLGSFLMGTRLGQLGNQFIINLGTKMQQAAGTHGVTGNPANIASLYSACRILSENLSRMPLSIYIDNENGRTELRRHRLSYLLNTQPNSYINAQKFWSTIEYHRNEYGNALARIHKNSTTAYVEALEIIHPTQWVEYYFTEAGQLVYVIQSPTGSEKENIPATDLLHFIHGLSENGIVSLNPLQALRRANNINERASSTIDHFYENGAQSNLAVTTELPTGNVSGGMQGVLTEERKQFKENYVGPENTGKPWFLPIGTKIQSISQTFGDARLIETLKFTREEISAVLNVPLFMIDGSAENLDVEQLTTLFKNNSMGPITAMYINEINYKLLTRQEIERGITAGFDIMKLIAMDYETMVNAIQTQVANGLMTPNEGSKKLGNRPIPGTNGNLHYMQAQYIPLEDYEQYNPLYKTDPNLKQINKKPKENDNNKED